MALRRTSLRGEARALLVVAATTCVPLWTVDLLPCSDLPAHVGIAAVLGRLMAGDAGTALYHEAQLQPVAYHTAYLLLVPAVAALGPWLGVKLFFTALALLHLAALAAWRRAFGLVPTAYLLTPFLFYGPAFFWGFIATQVGVPLLMLFFGGLVLGLQTGRRGPMLAAALAGAAGVAAQGTLAPVAAVFALAALAVPWPEAGPALARRRAWALAATAWALLPALGLAVAALRLAGGGGPPPHWSGPAQLWNYLRLQAGPFDRGPGRAAHVALWLVLAAGWIRAPRALAAPSRRCLALAALGCALLFVGVPSAWGPAWGLNFRHLSLVEVLVLSGALGRRPARGQTAALGLAAAAWLAALVDVELRWAARARPFEAVAAQVPAGATVAVDGEAAPLPGLWPPPGRHLPSWFLAQGAGFVEGGFFGGHLPVRRRPGPGRPPGQVGGFDLLLQVDGGDGAPRPAPRDGVQIAAAGPWRLFRRCGPCAPEN